MGRFNLNQILSDTSKAAAGGGSAKPRPSESRYEKLSVFDLAPSEDNFYSMREIGELKAAIEIAGKVLQNLVVVPMGDGKYKVIAGHRRRLASIELVNDGKPEYEFVPCVIEPTEEAADEQEIRDGLDLIVTNSQREKTAWDKIEEVRYLREVLEKAKTKPRFVELLRRIAEKTFEDGELQTDGTRDFIAKVLHTGMFERDGSKRLPISEFMGPSTAQMAGNSIVLADVEEKAQEVINKRVEHEITRILNGYGG